MRCAPAHNRVLLYLIGRVPPIHQTRECPMLTRSLAVKLFEAFSIQRWNEKIRPVELVEMDKTAHKMILAWCLGRCEEDAGRPVDWAGLVSGGIFELLRRIVISDIKSPIYNRIREEHPDVFREWNEWIFR